MRGSAIDPEQAQRVEGLPFDFVPRLSLGTVLSERIESKDAQGTCAQM